MARTRASARTPGKSDPIDAPAVARAALREPNLPLARQDDASREVKLLVDRREDLLGQRTATINRLLWRLHELDPELTMAPSALMYKVHREATSTWLETQSTQYGYDRAKCPTSVSPLQLGEVRPDLGALCSHGLGDSSNEWIRPATVGI